MDDEVARFGQLFARFMERMTEGAWEPEGAPLRQLLDTHFGADASTLPVVVESFASYDHVNVQVGLDGFLEDPRREHELTGITGHHRHFESLSDLLHAARHVRLGSVDLVNLPTGPSETLACVQFGMYLIKEATRRFALLVRGPTEFGPQQSVTLEILSADPDEGRALLDGIRREMAARNVFRGKVFSFGEPHMGRMGLGPVVFHERPDLRRDDLVLPENVLDLVERQTTGIASHRERLRASGQHVKRGLLLYGPPGNGKTLTVRYVMSRARDHTIVLLTGGTLPFLREACVLARTVEPAVIVLEDVDLVAEERGMYPGGNPVLFDLLNEMDGVDEDADVTFILTTNRADLLEPALAARPGRIDVALDIPMPDAEARRRLIQLYGRGLDLRLDDVESVVGRTEGVAASFIKELMRKAALIAASRGDGSGRVVVSDTDISSALDELLDERNALTRVLLGGRDPSSGRRIHGPPHGWLGITELD